MSPRLIRWLAGCAMTIAVPGAAMAQAASQCLTPKEAQGLITFALPDIIVAVSGKCAPPLGPDGYLTRSGTDLANRYRTAAAPSWPSAKLALRKFANADAALFDNMPDDAIKGFFGAGVATTIVKDVKPAQCGDIDRVMKVLSPLPPENMSQLVGIVLEMSARPPAQATAAKVTAKAKAPFSICPQSGGAGKPVTTK